MDYILKASGIITLFFVVYKLFLERDTFFQSIRLFLLAGIALTFIIPLINITTYVEAPAFVSSGYQVVNTAVNSTVAATPFDWVNLLTSIYVIGVLIAALYLIFNIFSLVKLLSQNKFEKYNNLKIITTDKQISPFSFFNYIVYNPSHFSETELKQLLNHEQTHALQRHSIDMLMAQLLVCLQWFNPLAWLYKKAVNQNLEYIADKSAKHIITPKNYSYLLLKTTQPHYQMALANNFYNSLLKKRIMMLHKNNSHRLKQFKLTLILPLLVGFVLTFNTKVVAQHKKDSKTEIETVNIDALALTFDKNASKEDFDALRKLFKEEFGIKINVKNLKRNTKNEIIGIKINATGKGTMAQYGIWGDTPIQAIEVKYNNKKNILSITPVSSRPKQRKVTATSYSYTVKFDSLNNKGALKINKKLSDYFDEKFNLSDDDKSTKVVEVRVDKKGKTTTKTIEVVEVKTAGKPTKSKTVFKIDKDGNIIRVGSKKGNKFIIKEIDVDDGKLIDLDATNINDKFVFSISDGGTALFVVNGKVMKDGFFKKLDPSAIKSVTILKGVKAIKKYGRKGKNGVIEITLKKKE